MSKDNGYLLQHNRPYFENDAKIVTPLHLLALRTRPFSSTANMTIDRGFDSLTSCQSLRAPVFRHRIGLIEVFELLPTEEHLKIYKLPY